MGLSLFWYTPPIWLKRALVSAPVVSLRMSRSFLRDRHKVGFSAAVWKYLSLNPGIYTPPRLIRTVQHPNMRPIALVQELLTTRDPSVEKQQSSGTN